MSVAGSLLAARGWPGHVGSDQGGLRLMVILVGWKACPMHQARGYCSCRSHRTWWQTEGSRVGAGSVGGTEEMTARIPAWVTA